MFIGHPLGFLASSQHRLEAALGRCFSNCTTAKNPSDSNTGKVVEVRESSTLSDYLPLLLRNFKTTCRKANTITRARKPNISEAASVKKELIYQAYFE